MKSRFAGLFRFRVFAWHLLGSAVLLASVLSALYFGWYEWPGWYLAGAESIVGLMILVDIGVGPVATLVVADPGKLPAKLAGDIVLIIVVQLVALGYGIVTLWSGRPLYYAFSASAVEMVAASDIKAEDAQSARSRNSGLAPQWYSRPRWVWAQLPQDPSEFGRLLTTRLLQGEDVTAMPQYFHELSTALTALQKACRPISVFRQTQAMSGQDYASRLGFLGHPASDVCVLPISGRAREGAMIFERSSGKPVAYWPVKVPLAATDSRAPATAGKDSR